VLMRAPEAESVGLEYTTDRLTRVLSRWFFEKATPSPTLLQGYLGDRSCERMVC
jgi:hypothetical protein